MCVYIYIYIYIYIYAYTIIYVERYIVVERCMVPMLWRPPSFRSNTGVSGRNRFGSTRFGSGLLRSLSIRSLSIRFLMTFTIPSGLLRFGSTSFVSKIHRAARFGSEKYDSRCAAARPVSFGCVVARYIYIYIYIYTYRERDVYAM